MKKFNRIDKILIVFALLLLAGSLTLLLGDYEVFEGPLRRDNGIGLISEQHGDVRLKMRDTLSWQNSKTQQDIAYDDSIFVGKNSKARISLSGSQFDIHENSLVIFRERGDKNFLEIGYGQVYANMAEGEKIFIRDESGRPVELNSKQKSEVVLKKDPRGKIELVVKSGDAHFLVKGKPATLIEKAPSHNEIELQRALQPIPDIVYEEFPPEMTDLDLLESPLIDKPYARETLYRDSAHESLELDIKKPESAVYVWYQIFRAGDLDRPYRSFSHLNGSFNVHLPDGDYRIRAASVYQANDRSLWTDFVNFKVETRVPQPVLNLAQKPQSKLSPLKIDDSEKRDIIDELHADLNRQVASRQEESSISEALSSFGKKRFRSSGFWTWLGGGYNFSNYKQNVPSIGRINDNNLNGPGVYAEVGYQGQSGFGGIISYNRAPGEIRIQGSNIKGEKYSWSTISLESTYRLKELSFSNVSLIYGPRLGVQLHNMPYIHQEVVLMLKKLEMQTASVGFFAQLRHHRMNYHWSMRYQLPLGTKISEIDGFHLSPQLSFDGSLGLSYNLTEQWTLGWFWYGQWHGYQFGFNDAGAPTKGTQHLFYSNMDFRLGYQF